MPQNLPLISVIIPTYNRADKICKCVESVISQTYSPLEIIVVDDNSSDNTLNLLSKYEKYVRCIALPKNVGAQGARNAGIRFASGDWVAFLDSDDLWCSDKLERQVEALGQCKNRLMTVIHTDCWRYDLRKNNKHYWRLPLFDGKNIYSKLLASPGPMFQGMLVAKVALEKIGMLDESLISWQEWDTSIRLARVCEFRHIREPLFVYHQYNSDAISMDKRRDYKGYNAILKKHYDAILTECDAGVLHEHISGNVLRAVKDNCKEEALDCLRLAKQTPVTMVAGMLVRLGVQNWVLKKVLKYIEITEKKNVL